MCRHSSNHPKITVFNQLAIVRKVAKLAETVSLTSNFIRVDVTFVVPVWFWIHKYVCDMRYIWTQPSFPFRVHQQSKNLFSVSEAGEEIWGALFTMSQATKRKHVVKEVLGDFVTPTGNQQIVKVNPGLQFNYIFFFTLNNHLYCSRQ